MFSMSSRFLAACLLGLVAIARGAMAGDVPLVGEEARAVLERVATHESRFTNVVAEFHLTVLGRPPVGADARDGESAVHGTFSWARLGERERLHMRYDLPSEQRVQQYHERDVYLDGDLHVNCYLPSNQVVITREWSLLQWPQPLNFYLPYLPARPGFASLLAGDAAVSVSRDGEHFQVRIAGGSLGEAGELRLRVDPSRDYAITAWEHTGRKLRAEIEWSEGAAGEFIPTLATITSPSVDPVRVWQLRTSSIGFDTVADEDVSFAFRPGMLVGDYSANERDAMQRPVARVYEIDESGQPVSVAVLDVPKPLTAGQTVAVGASAGTFALVLAAARTVFLRA